MIFPPFPLLITFQVFSTELPSREQGSHNLYNPNSGTSLPDTWSISYGDGSGASGNVFADTVVIGPVTATSQAVEAATSVSSEFEQGAGDGLVGCKTLETAALPTRNHLLTFGYSGL